MCKTNTNFENFENTVNLIYTLCAMLEMMIWTTFTIASGVQISKTTKCAKQTAISKTFTKYCKSHKHSVRKVGNDDLNYVCYSLHDAPHRSRNFEYAKMCKTNSNFENFENTVNLIYTMCAMLEMIIWTTFIIASGVQISKTTKCAKQTAISKTLKIL